MKAVLLQAAFLAFHALCTSGQIITATNALGYTVVEDVTLNPLGLPTTEVLSTILTPPTSKSTPSTTSAPSTSTTPTTQAAATQAQAQPQGPVEQSPDVPGVAGPTSYIYSTTNAAGATITVAAIFTPTFAPTTVVVPTASGTILQYSDWLTQVGTHTVPVNAAGARLAVDRTWYAVAGGTLLGVVGGALIVLA